MKPRREEEQKWYSLSLSLSLSVSLAYYFAQGDEEIEESSSSQRVSQDLKEEFTPAPEDAKKPMGSERAFLRAREQKLDLDSKVGKTQIVSPADGEGVIGGAAAPGWFCEVCKCLLKDSASYLDHINGKKRKSIHMIFLTS